MILEKDGNNINKRMFLRGYLAKNQEINLYFQRTWTNKK